MCRQSTDSASAGAVNEQVLASEGRGYPNPPVALEGADAERETGAPVIALVRANGPNPECRGCDKPRCSRSPA
jgi:hypothetical protein